MTSEYDAKTFCLPNNRRIAILKDGVWWCSICNRRLVKGVVAYWNVLRCMAFGVAMKHFNEEHRI